MYANLHKKGHGGFKNYRHWSSTENGSNHALIYDFRGDGKKFSRSKCADGLAHAVQAF